MTDGVRRYLVAYDIVDDRRRARVSSILQAYGARLQYSLFQVDLRLAHKERLLQRLRDAVNRREDSVMIFDLGLLERVDESAYVVIGRRGLANLTDCLIV